MTTATHKKEARTVRYLDNGILDKPYYEEVNGEVEDLMDAWKLRRAVSLLGPTGCGKSTLAEYVAYMIGQEVQKKYGADAHFPYIEIPCHEDITERHFLGGFGADGKWVPGPLHVAATAPYGAMIVLDEFVEARKDAQVLIHAPTDDRRSISFPKTGEVIYLPDELMVLTCYNPGYQIKTKTLKPSTRQRFITLQMDYPDAKKEQKILVEKTGIDEEIAKKLVSFANEIRKKAKGDGATLNLQEGASTRLLVMASEWYQLKLQQGKTPDLRHIAVRSILNPLTNESTEREALEQLLEYL